MRTLSTRARMAVVGVAVVVLAGAGGWYAVRAADRSGATGSGSGAVTLAAGQWLVFRSTVDGPSYGHLAEVPESSPRSGRAFTADRCARAYAAAGSGVCLRPSTENPGGYEIALLGPDAAARRAIPMNGIPSRARVSASGRMVSWTTFVAGDSYTGTSQFSTRSGILDTTADVLAGTLETFTLTMNGRPYEATDLNYWGVTFTRDDNHFYATAGTGGKRYLVEGDFARRTFRTLRENVECPSLSPDGTRIAYKKRVSSDPTQPWRFAVLDLATMRETLLAEPRSVDDQPAWLDSHTVMYGVRRDARHADVWAVPADGTGRPGLLIPDAESPAALSP
ncbi:TolB-like translocation protein [Fodinicola feengrottensis]|uniref:PD40 domain-containing protein n=1 Tax=Fodinicola feengrottensis TaxID=435914 RepID=A0ABN2IUP5_9ACTN|nr:hypothetical protein [Fodinicola feengrottensis]